MARLFTSASSEYLEHAAAVVSAGQNWTVSGLAYPTTTSTIGSVFSIANSANTTDFFRLDQTSSNTLRFRAVTSDAITANTWTTNAWNHFCGTHASSNTSRWVYLNNGTGVQNTTSRAPTVNRTGIGALVSSTRSLFFEGRIAEVGVWNVILTAEERTALSQGISPLLIRPESLVAYWPTVGRASPEIDLVGAYNMTVTGAVAAEHCRIVLPASSRWLDVAAALGSGPHTAEVPVSGITVSALAPIAATTEAHKVAIPAKDITVAALAPTAATTELHKVAVPAASISVAAAAASTETTEANYGGIPAKSITLAAFAPSTVTTEAHTAALPVQGITVSSLAPVIRTGEQHTIAVPVAAITVATVSPASVTTELSVTALPSTGIVVSASAPQVVTTGTVEAEDPFGGGDAWLTQRYLEELRKRKKKAPEEQTPVEAAEDLVVASIAESNTPEADPVPDLYTSFSLELEDKLKDFVSVSATLRAVEAKLLAIAAEEAAKREALARQEFEAYQAREAIIRAALEAQVLAFQRQQEEIARKIQEMHEEEEAMLHMLLMH